MGLFKFRNSLAKVFAVTSMLAVITAVLIVGGNDQTEAFDSVNLMPAHEMISDHRFSGASMNYDHFLESNDTGADPSKIVGTVVDVPDEYVNNSIPVVSNPVPDQTITAGSLLSFILHIT